MAWRRALTPQSLNGWWRELTALIDRRGKPGLMVSDTGTEFTCNTVRTCSGGNQIAKHFIAPRKPMQDAEQLL